MSLGYEDFLSGYELNTAFAWGGGSYLGAMGDRSAGLTLGDGGFGAVADLTLVATAAQFNGSFPVAKDLITIGTESFRVDSVTYAPDLAFVVLALVASNRGV